MLKDKIEALKAEISQLKAQKAEEVEALRIKYLSKKVRSLPSLTSSRL